MLYPGIDLCYIDVVSDPFSTHHEALGHIMQINYCKAGQVAWKTQNGNSIFLNPGDFRYTRWMPVWIPRSISRLADTRVSPSA